ncbi:hypothetical protein [Sphingopyxis granuli]|uniref:hypothetical protein n=1 Tax=Sphingopyxis granuli TaxID=267128 RepID=UPI001BAEFC71|nr:hypothetical protein [Sphingopyxis granuli]QUM73353.1 hypothetical protein ICN83_05555 [Sphingopyxis granuli]
MAADHLEAIRSVHQAALGLTLACTELVGPVSMALSLPTVSSLGQPIPRRIRRDIAKIEKGRKRV